MACWGSPVSSSVNIKDEWALADIFASDSNTHKALLNITLVPLLCAGLTGAKPLLNAPFDNTADGQWRRGGGGLCFTSGSIQPTIETLWKTNVYLAKVKALEPRDASVWLPRLWRFVLFPARLDGTFNETQADLIPGHFPLDQYIRLHEPDIRIMRRGEKNCGELERKGRKTLQGDTSHKVATAPQTWLSLESLLK